MNTPKKLLISLYLAMIALLVMGGLWQPAAARSGTYPLEKGQTIGLGRQGLYISNIPLGVTQVQAENIGTELPPQLSYTLRMPYRAPAMAVRFADARGNLVSRIDALVYVYFDLARAEASHWSEGGMENIAIWYASLETGEWEACHSYYVKKGDGVRTHGRLVCLAPGSGYYLLAYPSPRSAGGNASSSGVESATLTVRAFIDGRSQLILQGNILRWQHLDFQAPGRWIEGGGPKPTYLNGVAWYPTWPDKPNATNEDCKCSSSTYTGIPALAKADTEQSSDAVSLRVITARGNVTLVQQPTAANDYTLIVEMDDNVPGGAAWYEIQLNYRVAP
jgi:hypothetical protein